MKRTPASSVSRSISMNYIFYWISAGVMVLLNLVDLISLAYPELSESR